MDGAKALMLILSTIARSRMNAACKRLTGNDYQ